MSTVPFTEEAVRAYLDEAIVRWRDLRDASRAAEIVGDVVPSKHTCACYVDAFQSVRMSLFGETLP